MKEYLDPDNGYALIVADDDIKGCSNWIEVPDGAECLTECMDEGEIFKLWWKGSCKISIGFDKDWLNINREIDDYLSDYPNAKILWKRDQEPMTETEYLMQDEKLMASVKELKHSHYKKDISHLDVLDVYRVLELFNVTNPCVQHAVKKLLCSGQRGVKDSDRDIDEAIDSLQRYSEMKIEDSRPLKDWINSEDSF